MVDVKQSTRYYTSSPVVKSRRYDRFLDHGAMEVSSKSCFCNREKLSLIELHEKKIIENLCERVGNQWMAAYPWKKDRNLPTENRSQALKKLETTERRLMKNPDSANDYDKQIKEMTNFVGKLSGEEIKNHESPVHYIAHQEVVRLEKKSAPVRIVFNSSASYEGHKLNDYWVKRLDLRPVQMKPTSCNIVGPTSGGFEVKGWISNRDLGNDDSFRNDSSDGAKSLANETAEKVLGLARNHRKGVFSFEVKSSKPKQTSRQ